MGVKQAPVPVGERAEPGDSMLVLSSPLSTETDTTCTDLLTSVDDERIAALWVTLLDAPGERVRHWEHHCDASPDEAAVITVGDRRTVDVRPTIHGDTVTVSSVGSPRNLTRLGVEILDHLDQWSVEEDTQVVLCFHSLTAFLQYLNVQEAFKFIHALTAELTRAGAIAHFHMDPDAHDDRTVSTMLPLFRSVVELDDDGEWTYRSR